MRRNEWLVFRLNQHLLEGGLGFFGPRCRVAVSTGHKHFGLIFLDVTIGAVFLASILIVRESKTPAVGAASALVLCGVALLRLGRPETLAPGTSIKDTLR